jgi:ABC-type multidrug transport system ATPase subunit
VNVFLDEPSSGLDPTSRRHLWEVIDHYKKGRSIILTTHSMEEADTLCTRIGIIAKGRLQCLGSPIHLKNKFGKGYSLYINFKRDGIDTGSEYIDKLLNGKYEIVNSVGTYRIYRTDKGSVKVSNLLREMELNKDKYDILLTLIV